MKLFLCTLAIAAAKKVGSVHPSKQDTVFGKHKGESQGPQCFLHKGRTIVHYNADLHVSFKCVHTSATTCACTWTHPTHHSLSLTQQQRTPPQA